MSLRPDPSDETNSVPSPDRRDPLPRTASRDNVPDPAQFVVSDSFAETREHDSTPVPPERVPLPKIPGYEVTRPIGRGGMGMVYEALHLHLNRPVALKILHHVEAYQAALHERFTREVRTLASVHHPNIVNVYDAGTWEGRQFFTMTLIRGGTLYDHSKRLHQDRRAACALMAKVARALAALHEQQILHRDLKPQNILIDERGEPFVADFGLALWIGRDSDLSVTNSPIGTRHYMPPEQTLGRKSDYAPACDIWSLGVILYELLTAAWPFHHEDPVELYRQIRFDPVPPFSKYDPTIPAELEAVTRKCLAKRPEARYASAEQLADDLERWLAGQPVTAPPVPKKRFPRRGFAIGAAGLAVLLAVAFGASGRGPTPEPKPEPIPAPALRTVSQRLAEGETIELIGETGKPKVPTIPVHGREGEFELDHNGFAMLSSAGEKAVIFDLGEIRLPIRYEMEYALNRHQGNWSGAGAIVGLHNTMDGEANRLTMLRGFHHETATDMEIAMELLAWYMPKGLGTHRFVFGVPLDSKTEKPSPNTIEWHRLAFELHPDRCVSRWDDKLISSLPVQKIDDKLDSPILAKAKFPPVNPWKMDIGRTLGVCADNSEAVFRNVRIIPMPLNPIK